MHAPIGARTGIRDSEGMGFPHITHPADQAAEALLELRRKRRRHVLLSRDDGAGEALAIVEHGHVLRSTQALNELIETLCRERIAFEPSQGVLTERWGIPARHFESLDRLCWLFGERFARERGLLSCLSARGRYRLLAWPDFSEIGSDAQGAALCHLLAREAVSPQEAALRLAFPAPLTFGLFNSAALCGALVAEEKRRPGPQGGSLAWSYTAGSPAQHTLFGDLWRRLTG